MLEGAGDEAADVAVDDAGDGAGDALLLDLLAPVSLSLIFSDGCAMLYD